MVASWKIGFAALLIFGAGMVTGGLGSRAAFRALRRAFPETRENPGRMETTPAGTTNRTSRPTGYQRLETYRRVIGAQPDLKPAQRQRIEALIDETGGKIQELWNPVAPLVQSEIRELRHRIEEELTPAQKERFDSALPRRNSTGAANPTTNPPSRGRSSVL